MSTSVLNIDRLLRQALEHHQAGRLEAAAQGYQAILQQNVQHSDALHLLGVVAQQQGKFEAAIELIKAAIAQNASMPHYHHNLGNTYLQAEQPLPAIECYRQAIQLKPNYYEAHNGMGNALAKLNIEDVAAEAYRSAISLNPSFAEAHYNLGRMLDMLDKPEEAIACYRTATQLDRANPDYHFNLSGLLLMQGQFAEGWKEYEWRWKLNDFPNMPRERWYPRWNGEPLFGKKILLHAEQGYGDTLQFVRYIPLVAERGGEIILEVQPALHRLLSGYPGVSSVIAQGDPVPAISCQCPLMSLPLVFGTSFENIPISTSYIKVPEQEIEKAKSRWPGHGLRVGIAWAGAKTHRHNNHRSMTLDDFAPLGSIPGITLYSLQVGEAAKQLHDPSLRFSIQDASSRNTDFAQTAAFIAGLDLVITVDTSVAHLAGALGIPVWILLAYNRIDWRWFKNREDSPWYPTARLFRQAQSGDWSELVSKVCTQIEKLVTNAITA